jgi:hypothetical protein
MTPFKFPKIKLNIKLLILTLFLILSSTALHTFLVEVNKSASENQSSKGQVLQAASGTYYVATWGDDSNPGTFAEPWATFNYADTQASAGDTVYVRGGTYTERIILAANGTSGNLITWQNYAEESPVIQEHASPPTSSSHVYRPRVTVTGDYVIFRGFEVRNSEGRGIELFKAVRSEVRDCVVHHCWSEGIIVDNNYGTDTYAVVDGCTVHHCALILLPWLV